MHQQAKHWYMPLILFALSVIFLQGCAISPRDYLNAGIQLYDQKQWDKAEAQFSKAIENKDDFTEAHFYRGMCRINMGNNEKAKEDFEKVVQLESGNVEALVRLSEINILDKDYSKAIENLEKASKLKDSVTIRNLMGIALYRQGKFEDAFKQYAAAQGMEPENVDVQSNLGLYYYEIKHDPAKAREYYEKALKTNPTSSELNRRMGNILQLENDYDAAVERYRKSLESDPGNKDAMMDLAFALYQIGDFEESMKTVGGLLEKNKEIPLALVLRGMLYLHQKDGKDKAKADFEQAAKIAPNMPDAHIRLGMFLLEQEKDPKGAAAEFDKAIEASPANSIANYFAAKAYYAAGNKAEASKRLNEALKINPRIYFDEALLPQKYFDDAKKDESRKMLREILACQKKGNVNDAFVKITEFIGQNPNSEIGQFYAGNILFVSSKPADAMKSFNEAVKLNPDFLQAYLSRGNVLFEMGKNREALADYDKALRIDPLCVTALTSKGNVYALGLNNYKSALKQFEEVLKIAPDFCEAYFFKGKCLMKLGKKKEAAAALEQFVKTAGDSYREQKTMAQDDLKKLKKK
ncbi:MAG: tetratricopeptide repeat protein [Firmicutes bacterium]|nr:tetratricopeptide repeat protein [Bacillota bacterium]